MKLAMSMTLDALVRALRWKVHDLAEAVEDGDRPGKRDQPVRWSPRPDREQADDLTRR